MKFSSPHRAAGAILILVLGAHQFARAQGPEPLETAGALEAVLVNAIARSEGAVVAIARDDGPLVGRNPDPFNPLPRIRNPAQEDAESGTFTTLQFGSGVLVADPADPDSRLVLTTFHVVFGDTPADPARAVNVTLTLRDSGTVVVRAVPVAADRRIDLAVLRFESTDVGLLQRELPTLSPGNADDLRKGQLVVALGNPYALARDGSPSASFGMVSNIGRRPQPPPTDGFSRRGESMHDYGTLVTVDTRLELGGSGGPLLDLHGNLIGLTTALAALQGYEKSAGFAIPFDSGTRRIISEMLHGYEAEYGFLGISPEPFRWTRPDGRTVATVRVAHVALHSPAEQAGLRTGDLVLQIDGQLVADVADLMRIIGLRGPGAAAEMIVQRGGDTEPLTLSAQLGKWPVYDDADVLSTQPRRPPWRGLTVDYPTARQRYLSSDRLEEYRRAVVVTEVAEGSAAAAAGLKSGDFIRGVNDTAVQTPDEFANVVEGQSGPVSLTLWDDRNVQISP